MQYFTRKVISVPNAAATPTASQTSIVTQPPTASQTPAVTQLRIQHPRWGVVCMLMSVGFFSLNSLTLKYLSDVAISPWMALLFRSAVGLIVLATLFGSAHQVSFRRALTDRWLASRGLLGVLGTIAYYFTIPQLGPGKATLISNTYVVLAALMAVWFLREAFSLPKLLGNLLAVIGLAMLVAAPGQLVEFGWYEALAVIGALAAAGTVIIIRQLTLTETTAMIYTSQCVFVFLCALPFAMGELGASVLSGSSGLNASSVAVLILAALSATIGQLAMTEGFRHLTVAVGGAFQICVPVMIAIGGVCLFDEAFTPLQIAGAALILAGCYWVTVQR